MRAEDVTSEAFMVEGFILYVLNSLCAADCSVWREQEVMFVVVVAEQEELESVLDRPARRDPHLPQRPQICSNWERCKNQLHTVRSSHNTANTQLWC